MATDFMPQLQASIAEIGSHAKKILTFGRSGARFTSKAKNIISPRLAMLNGRAAAAGVLQAATVALSVVATTHLAATASTSPAQIGAVRPSNVATVTTTSRGPAFNV